MQETVKIIARDDKVNSFIQEQNDKFNFQPKKGDQYLGADFEIMQTILKSLNIPYSFQIVPPADFEEMLRNGDADMGLGLKKTPETSHFVDFPRIPMRSYDFVFYGRKQEAKTNTMTYEQATAHNYNVGILVGSLYPQAFWDAFPFENKILNNHLFEWSSYEVALSKLIAKKIDIFLGNKLETKLLIDQNKMAENVFQYRNVLYTVEYFCGFSKKSKLKNLEDLQAKVQKALYKMQENNSLQPIDIKWHLKKVAPNFSSSEAPVRKSKIENFR